MISSRQLRHQATRTGREGIFESTQTDKITVTLNQNSNVPFDMQELITQIRKKTYQNISREKWMIWFEN